MPLLRIAVPSYARQFFCTTEIKRQFHSKSIAHEYRLKAKSIFRRVRRMALSPEQIQGLVDEFLDSLTDAQRQGLREGEAVLVPTTANYHASKLVEGRSDVTGLDYIRLSQALLEAFGYGGQSEVRHGGSNLPSEGRSVVGPSLGMDVSMRAAEEAKPKSILLSELGVQRIRTMRAQDLAVKTIMAAESKHKQFVEILGDRPISDNSPDDFLSFRESLVGKYAERTIYNTCIVLSTLFNFSVESGHLERSRVPRWQKPKALKCNKGWQPFGDDDVQSGSTPLFPWGSPS